MGGVPLPMAMVGGGPDAFIGPVHWRAAELDGEIRLVAGAFSSDPARSREAGRRYGIADDRCYATWQELIAAEAARPDGARLVVVVTPNHLHLPVARAALEAGMAVVSDKPATATLAEARTLAEVVTAAASPYVLTYTYSGYAMIRHARSLVAARALGNIRKVVVDYPQGWLSSPIETTGNKQASWRTDPACAGAGGCIGDIGVHAFHLAEYVSGQRVTRVLGDIDAMVPGRALDDDAAVLLRFDNGARGVLLASQVATGELNGLRLRIYGEKAMIDWRHDAPTVLTLNDADGRTELIQAGTAAVGSAGASATRLPSGHPEGFIEAFANIYRDFAAMVRGEVPELPLPDIADGVRSLAFVETALASSRAGSVWMDLDTRGEAQ